eukprot:9724036-Ditylum_brightwellii.AAC.1
MTGVAMCNPQFSIAEWDRLIDQANLALNLLCTYRVNPSLSTYAYLFGNHSFNAHPLAPLGCKVVVNKKTDQSSSYGYHGSDGWYIGPSFEHYRCLKCFLPSTGAVVDTDTLDIIEHDIPIPVLSGKELIQQAIAEIIHRLKNLTKVLPTFYKGNEAKNAFAHLANY